MPTRNLMRRPSLSDTASTDCADGLELRAVAGDGGLGNAGRRAVLAEDLAQRRAPFARRDAGLGGRDRRLHDVAAFLGGALDFREGRGGLFGVAVFAPGLEFADLLGFHRGIDDHDRVDAAGQRRRLGFGEFVDADDDHVAGLDLRKPAGVALDEAALHVVDRRDGAAHFLDRCEFGLGFFLQRRDLPRDLDGAVEDVAVLEQIRLVGDDLLHAQRPLLIPRARQAERLVPGRQLHGARARIFRQRHGQHFDQDAIDVVLGLRLGEAERVDLHAVAEHAGASRPSRRSARA